MTTPPKPPALRQLARIIGDDHMITGPLRLLTYEMDAGLDRGKPEAVVFPRTTDDVVHIVQWARQNNTPLVARGAGTGLSGGAVAEHGGVIVEFSRMNQIVEIDEVGRTAVVQPGVVSLVLDQTVRARELYFPPDPSSGRVATLGGTIAENSGGPHCLKYGVTTNYVTGLQVVLADGRVVQMGGRAIDYPEYDFVGVMTGSEGTLGIVTQASVRLIRPAPAIQTLMVAFDSVAEAGHAVSSIIARGIVPATLEMMDRKIMRILEDYTHAGLPVDAHAALIIEVDGYPESLSPQMDAIVAILDKHRARDLRLARTAEERDDIWYARKSVGGALSRIAPSYYPVDGTVPRSKIAETIAAIEQIGANLDLPTAYVLHAGDGNIHPHIFINDPADSALVARVLEAGKQVMQLCVTQGGTITGEHGVGTEKRLGMPLMYSSEELRTMLDVRDTFDPDQRLNPGKIFPPDLATPAALPTPPAAPVSPCAPASTQEAAGALRAWTAPGDGKTVRIRGGGTKSSLLGPTDAILSTQALAGILTHAPEDLYVTVGAGTRLCDLQRELARDGMWLPLVSPWDDATVGGIVATNSNAPLRMRVGYGSVRDLVLAITVVMPQGQVIRAGRPVVKNVAGYDMTKLFVGSFGTLGLIADVTFRTTPLPRTRASLITPFPDLESSLSCGDKLLGNCLVASAVLLCRGINLPGVAAPFSLIYSAEGLSEDVAVELEGVRRLIGERGVAGTIQSERTGSELWAKWLAAVLPTQGILRAGVPAKDLAGLVWQVAALEPEVTFIADLANGQLYVSSLDYLDQIRQAACEKDGYAVVLGAPAGARVPSDIWGCTPDTIGLMRALKRRWDPRGLLNPGTFLV